MGLSIGGGVRSIRTRNAPDIDDTDAWEKRAACRDYDPESWFPVGHGALAEAQYEVARGICNTCPVQQRCLTESLERGDEWGMFGGQTPEERRPQRKLKDARNCLTCGDVFEPARSKQPNCGKCNIRHQAQGINQVQAFLAKFSEQLAQSCRAGVSDKAIAEYFGVSHYLIGNARQQLGIPAQPRWQNLRGAQRNTVADAL
jgi:WhiB family transcriptional regulator, redox-sensing transcriptional regulator